jgi:hypothetical protein
VFKFFPRVFMRSWIFDMAIKLISSALFMCNWSGQTGSP